MRGSASLFGTFPGRFFGMVALNGSGTVDRKGFGARGLGRVRLVRAERRKGAEPTGWDLHPWKLRQ